MKMNFEDMRCDEECARSFRRLLKNAGLLTDPVMGMCRPGDSLRLRNGALLKVRSIDCVRGNHYTSYFVVFVGLIGIKFEYTPGGSSLDSEFTDDAPAPFDAVMLERTEIDGIQ